MEVQYGCIIYPCTFLYGHFLLIYLTNCLPLPPSGMPSGPSVPDSGFLLQFLRPNPLHSSPWVYPPHALFVVFWGHLHHFFCTHVLTDCDSWICGHYEIKNRSILCHLMYDRWFICALSCRLPYIYIKLHNGLSLKESRSLRNTLELWMHTFIQNIICLMLWYTWFALLPLSVLA